MTYTLHHGDCLDILRTLPDNSIDAVVTDPPYGLSFMGKRWDYDVPSQDIWSECLRVLKPGGHLLAFAGTRTQHRMAVRIEDAGFEIRDMIAWVYGSGFPKSHDVSKAIDKSAGAEREVVGIRKVPGMARTNVEQGAQTRSVYEFAETSKKAATPAAAKWQGWGTALKPALEPITVARKPLIGTVAENVLTWGTGGVNVDGCRVEGVPPSVPQPRLGVRERITYNFGTGEGRNGAMSDASGRWPANLIHDGSEQVVGLFPETKSGSVKAHHKRTTEGGNGNTHGKMAGVTGPCRIADSGSAARFFYCAKASKRDRDEGCEGMEAKQSGNDYRPNDDGTHGLQSRLHGSTTKGRNAHPTVKPTDLMRYLCRLVTPPNGTVLDPFMGSGSTGKAAMLEDFNFVGIEREAEYLDIARARIEHAINNKPNRLL